MRPFKAFTLMETLVAILIFAIGMQGFVLLFLRAWRVNSFTLELGQSSLSASRGLDVMTDYIRKAKQGDDGSYPIQSASDNDLVIFGDYDKNGTAERLHFYKSGPNVMLGITRSTGTLPKTYPAGDQQIKTIISSVVNDSETPIFQFFNKNYPGDTINNPMTTPVSLADVRLIKIFLQVNLIPNRAPDNVAMQRFVELRNLNDYDRLQ